MAALIMGNGEVDFQSCLAAPFLTAGGRRRTVSVETEPDKVPPQPARFGRGRRLLVARHSRARFLREIRTRLMICEHTGRSGHYHDVECENAADPFPGNLALTGGQAFKQSAHRCLLLK